MTITPDLKQNILYMLYFIVLHNWQVIVYGMGIAIATAAALWRPRRSFVVWMIGFSLLLFAFEYDKHIQESLKDQTMQSLITVQEHAKVRRAVSVSIDKLIPYGLPLLGWTLNAVGVYLFQREREKKRRPLS
jgi:hypothetical protein